MLGNRAEIPLAVSRDLLHLCEELVVAPDSWDAWPDRKQQDIRQAFDDTMIYENRQALLDKLLHPSRTTPTSTFLSRHRHRRKHRGLWLV